MTDVLIVDDSATAREVLSAILSADDDLEVVGQAKNGAEAIAMTKELNPDVITMDINMPKMDGFEATEQIMREKPTPIVIASTSTRLQDVETGMQALRAGALTLVRKPRGPSSPDFEKSSQDFVALVKAMADVKVVRRYRSRAKESVKRKAKPTQTKSSAVATAEKTKAVVIVSSTGGPPALSAILAQLPATFPPILLVQHIAEGFVEGFVSWLDGTTPLTVKLAEDSEPISSGNVYVAPYDYHLGVTSMKRVRLATSQPVGGFRPAGTYSIESASKVFGDQLTAVILTGMGSDGIDGLPALRGVGGHVIAQDEDTSVVYGMPKAAVATGLTDAVLPLDQIAPHLLKCVSEG